MSLPPATIELRTSRALCAALVVLGCGAGIAVGLSDVPAWTEVLVPALLWAAWPRAPRWHALVLSTSGTASLIGPDATAEPLKLQVRGRLAVLALRVEGRVHRIVLALRADERRHLVLWFDRHARRAPREGWLAHV